MSVLSSSIPTVCWKDAKRERVKNGRKTGRGDRRGGTGKGLKVKVGKQLKEEQGCRESEDTDHRLYTLLSLPFFLSLSRLKEVNSLSLSLRKKADEMRVVKEKQKKAKL